MQRKVILDVDPGIDDAVAVCMALFAPELDVIAVTAVAGNVSAEQATRNVQAIIEQLDPPRWPRVGAASDPEDGLPLDARHLHGADGLGEANFPVAELHHLHASERVIAESLRATPDEITIITLGPLTNIARAFQRDPALPGLVNRLVMMGGTVQGPGNVTAAAEFNIYCDPLSARAVFHQPITKTLVPLDITSQVTMTYDLLDELPEASSRAGRFLHRVLPYAFRSHRQHLGLEGIYLDDAVALIAAIEPELFESKGMAGDVEVRGEITGGATLFDRRRHPQWRYNMEVITRLDTAAVRQRIIERLRHAGRKSA